MLHKSCYILHIVAILLIIYNIRHIPFCSIPLLLGKPKESRNKYLRGNVVDLSPSEQTETIPADVKAYVMLLQEVKDVTIHAFEGYDTGKKQGEIAIKNCSGIKL